jgi:hypothetical protein
MVSGPSPGSGEHLGDAPLGSRTQAARLDVENPWPGLASYDEASSPFFHGRNREAAELLRMIRLAALTALYGKSGLGKSSLLQAGLFPLLRAQHYLPVYLRIDFSNAVADPLEHVARRLEEELRRGGAEFPQRKADETLWEYLHREHLEIWSSDNFPLFPVLVFDQFEELFSRRASDAQRVHQIRDSLADLIENRIPAELATDEAKPKRARLNLLSSNYRVVISCREDYLPDLKSWEKDVPSLLRNYLRLEPMTRQCAIEAVERSGQTVLADGVPPLIVDFVGNINDGANKNIEPVIEPVLLCLCCYQLNRRRAADGKISAALVNSAGRDILDSFYRTALADPNVKGSPDAAAFIETFLVQGDRYRGAYPKTEAIDAKLLRQAQLDALTDQHRLLRIVQYSDTARIELIHDRLVEVVCKARDERKAAQAAARLKRWLWQAAAAIGVVFLALGVLFLRSYGQWEVARSWATLDSEATGRRYGLSQDVANVGRPTENVQYLIYQVELSSRAVSRIHLMIFRNFYAIDVRSLYGTTVNGEFLQYGDQRQLKDGDVIVPAGAAAFRFHPLKYQPWEYFWPKPLSDIVPASGWGLLIDGMRRQTFPLTQDEQFVAPAGEHGVELRDRPDGAIAIVRRVVDPMVTISDSGPIEVLEKRPEDPKPAPVRLWAFGGPGTKGRIQKIDGTFLTMENIANGQAMQAAIKLDDYTYGRFDLPPGEQYLHLQSSRGVRDHSLSELAFHQGGRRFQVIRLDPSIENGASDSGD